MVGSSVYGRQPFVKNLDLLCLWSKRQFCNQNFHTTLAYDVPSNQDCLQKTKNKKNLYNVYKKQFFYFFYFFRSWTHNVKMTLTLASQVFAHDNPAHNETPLYQAHSDKRRSSSGDVAQTKPEQTDRRRGRLMDKYGMVDWWTSWFQYTASLTTLL